MIFRGVNMFKFSIIMSVYNASEYIDEAISSILAQDIGFETNVQLVLVDDGSTDNSGEICDSYQKRYPRNVVVIHKMNEGLAMARKTGMKYAVGEYVNFFDPDDILSLNTLSSVYSFISNNKLDIVSIPLVMFGNQTGPHPTNNKFSKGTRIIDLTKEFEVAQLGLAPSFIRNQLAQQIEADKNLVDAEDAKELIKLLLKSKKLGVVSDCVYNYRKHSSSSSSSAREKKEWYLPYLKHFTSWARDYCMSTLGYFPRFVQYTVLYHLQWKLLQKEVPPNVLTSQELVEYQKKLREVAGYFDDDVILSMNQIHIEHKLFLLSCKYSKPPLILSNSRKSYIAYGNKLVGNLGGFSFTLDQIDITDSKLVICATNFVPSCGLPIANVIYEISGQVYRAKLKSSEKKLVAGMELAVSYKTEVVIPLMTVSESLIKIKLELEDGSVIEQERIRHGKWSPLTDKLEHSYYFDKGFLITNSPLKIAKYSSSLKKILSEVKFCSSICKKRIDGRFKVIAARWLSMLCRLVLPKIWLLMDKANIADDNAEVLFDYLNKQQKGKGVIYLFALNKESKDYARVKSLGLVIPYMGVIHKFAHLCAEHTISAYSHNEVSSPFFGRTYLFSNLLKRNKVVFLQHGITKDDVSAGLRRDNKNFTIFITAAEREYLSILHGDYGYSDKNIKLTGFPRYDYLYDDRKRMITLMPTWRSNLVGSLDHMTDQWAPKAGFEESNYFKFYNGLITSNRLKSQLREHGYSLAFAIHPVFRQYLSFFDTSDILVFDGSTRYRQIFAESDLLITDYSSVAFDFAYLKKPVIYTHFEGGNYPSGYFSYEKDGFGEVETTLEGTIERILEYTKSGCQMKSKYICRVDSFFEFTDKMNCARVFNAINCYNDPR